MARRALALSKVYQLLEPGPVVLLTTARRGRPNVMTMSWHTMMEFEPPRVGCVISDRNHSFAALKATRECAINLPERDLAEKVVECGNTSGRDVDKFVAFGLTAVPAFATDTDSDGLSDSDETSIWYTSPSTAAMKPHQRNGNA